MADYGKEVIIDLYNCNPRTFTRKSIRNYFKELCNLINMEREKLYWWDDFGVSPEEQQTSPKTKGTTAVQFMLTSNITIHTLVLLKRVYLNIFACKKFDDSKAAEFSMKWFEGEIVNTKVVRRL